MTNLARNLKLSGQICWQCQLTETLKPSGVCSSTITIAILYLKLKKSAVYQKLHMRLVRLMVLIGGDIKQDCDYVSLATLDCVCRDGCV